MQLDKCASISKPIDMSKNYQQIDHLSERDRSILKQIIESYISTGEPIGSKQVSQSLALDISSATIRNVMADLEELGLIYAPHISAGRLPTQLGLRFFVDTLLEKGALAQDMQNELTQKVLGQEDTSDVQSILNQASSALSGLSRGASLVLTNRQDMRLKQVEFVQIDPTKVLMIIVGENGGIENRVVDLPKGFHISTLIEASNVINAHMRGLTLSQAKATLKKLYEKRQLEIDQLAKDLIEKGMAKWANLGEGKKHLIVKGQANLLQDVKLEADIERIKLLFDDLEQESNVMDILSEAEQGQGIRIFIGSENRLFSMSGSAMIAAPFHDDDQNILGVLGIIGPTRLNYANVIPLVDYTARLVSQMLKEKL